MTDTQRAEATELLRRNARKLRRGRLVPCAECGAEVYRTERVLAKHPTSFCGRSCANKWRYKQDPEKWRVVALRASAQNKMAGTSIELALQRELTKRGIAFKTNWLVAGTGIADIFVPPRTVIFADGVYWHRYPVGLPKDHRITARLRKHGYEVWRFWEHEINENAAHCIEQVLEGKRDELLLSIDCA